ncbi:MAG: lipid A ethanolaminephosphotransferase [Candidatus Midichloriaceae bacterium]|jgi:lipid A ethanolaminephosphotransferase
MIKNYISKCYRFFKNPKIGLVLINLCISFYIVLFLNAPTWNFIFAKITVLKYENIIFLCSIGLVLFCCFYAVLSIFCIRVLHKSVVIFLLLASSLAQYFLLEYNIVIDYLMLENLIQTDLAESLELVTLKMVKSVFLFGIFPSILVYHVYVIYPQNKIQILKIFGFAVLSLIIAITTIYFQFNKFASFFRNNKEITYYIIPNNYLYSAYKLIDSVLPEPQQESNINTATKNSKWSEKKRKTIFVLVIGETARAQNFSLNGYERQTNPILEKKDVISYGNTFSCGTSTATSLPCIFSSLGRDDISKSKLKYNDNLLNLVQKSGFKTIWIDNNSGCKKSCDSAEYIDTKDYVNKNSITSEVYDINMLDLLEKHVKKHVGNEDLFVVLHQKGSHGPEYYKRVPKEFYKFTPICKTAELQNCSVQSLVNSYDNTILYTDFFLGKLIDLLKKHDDTDTALVYVSDHGESLGESNIYLHGMPYMIAPKEQKHVPMLMWFSQNYINDFDINTKCLKKHSKEEFSHDNLFYTILDMLDIKTKALKENMSILSTCK